VVIENVPGLGSAEIEEKSYADYIGEQFETVGYQVEVIRLEAAKFGVPQRRHRYFIFGVHHDLPLLNLDVLKRGIADEDVTQLKHSLFDLPPLSASDGRWISSHTDTAKQHKELAAKYLDRFHIRGQSKVLFSHVSRYNNEDDMQLFAALREGESYRRFIERTGKQPFTKYRDDNFPDKYYRLRWEGPSKTIVSHLGRDGNSFIHPRELRSLSVREAARIQSFPDDYIFCGSRKSQFVQIGNAVPPVMAEAIGRVLREALIEHKSHE
jgi:DNA (cytosine-5)-methyltransferase 1